MKHAQHTLQTTVDGIVCVASQSDAHAIRSFFLFKDCETDQKEKSFVPRCPVKQSSHSILLQGKPLLGFASIG
jgi:hypothetical protein